jgi:hypothetical protein
MKESEVEAVELASAVRTALRAAEVTDVEGAAPAIIANVRRDKRGRIGRGTTLRKLAAAAKEEERDGSYRR